MKHNTKPYKEQIVDDYILREFSQDTPSFEFVWHRDKEDRVVQAMHDTDWLLARQRDSTAVIRKQTIYTKRNISPFNKRNW